MENIDGVAEGQLVPSSACRGGSVEVEGITGLSRQHGSEITHGLEV